MTYPSSPTTYLGTRAASVTPKPRNYGEATNLVQAVKDRMTVKDYLDRFAPSRWQGPKCNSPLAANDSTPSFHYYEASDSWYCFSTGQGGDLFKLIELHQGMSFIQALEWGCTQTGVTFKRLDSFPKQRQNPARLWQEALEYRNARYMAAFGDERFSSASRDYVLSRGLNGDGFDFGHGLTFNAIFADAPAELKATLQEQMSDIKRFTDRWVFPIRNARGAIVAFAGRMLDTSLQGPKYINSENTPINGWKKGQTFFNAQALSHMRNSPKKQKPVWIFEGYVDVISTANQIVPLGEVQANWQHIQPTPANSLALMGTNLTAEHVKELVASGVNQIILCLDNDAAGQGGIARALETLANVVIDLHDHIEVKVATLPTKLGDNPIKDMADLTSVLKQSAQDNNFDNLGAKGHFKIYPYWRWACLYALSRDKVHYGDTDNYSPARLTRVVDATKVYLPIGGKSATHALNAVRTMLGLDSSTSIVQGRLDAALVAQNAALANLSSIGGGALADEMRQNPAHSHVLALYDTVWQSTSLSAQSKTLAQLGTYQSQRAALAKVERYLTPATVTLFSYASLRLAKFLDEYPNVKGFNLNGVKPISQELQPPNAYQDAPIYGVIYSAPASYLLTICEAANNAPRVGGMRNYWGAANKALNASKNAVGVPLAMVTLEGVIDTVLGPILGERTNALLSACNSDTLPDGTLLDEELDIAKTLNLSALYDQTAMPQGELLCYIALHEYARALYWEWLRQWTSGNGVDLAFSAKLVDMLTPLEALLEYTCAKLLQVHINQHGDILPLAGDGLTF